MYSSFGAVLAFLGSAMSQTYTQLIISRTFAGLFTGTIGTAFAYVSDVVKPRDRVKYLSYISAVMSTCFVVGPLIGGGLSNFSLRVPFYSAAGMAFVELCIVFFFIKEPSSFNQDIINSDASLPSSPISPETHRVAVRTNSNSNYNTYSHKKDSEDSNSSSLDAPLLEDSTESQSLLLPQENSSSSGSKTTWSQSLWLLLYVPPDSPYRNFDAFVIGGIGIHKLILLILYYTILYYTILYYTILYYTILYY